MTTNVYVHIDSLEKNLTTRIAELKKNSASLIPFREVIENALSDGKSYYGINTGFGLLATKRVELDSILELQRNLVLSHSVGVGALIPKEISRLMLQLKIHALGLGHSGVTQATFKQLCLLLEKDLIPAVPEKGSVGASGDLAPLAHLALPLIGEGIVWDGCGIHTLTAASALKEHNLSPVTLQAKEGLALLNGTQFMTAHGAYVLSRTSQLLKMCDIIGAMSLEAARGSKSPFLAKVQALRPHDGQAHAASNILKLLDGSTILESHKECSKVQDPYSLRCMAVVHGASRGALMHASQVIETEMNSVTDNPLVFDDGDIISAGNFHGQPIALAMDYAALALAELASISERRTYLLLSGYDELPQFLIEESGLHSGFMIPQYTQAALVSENKVLAHPASVDSIPTSNGQEDHVSMGSISATKLLKIFYNVQHVLGIELLCAAQALDFRKPLTSGKGIVMAHSMVRSRIPHRTHDSTFQDDFERVFSFLSSDEIIQAVESEIGELL
ncbi:MAG: histidine ammonia-lyase [Bdellovibrionota bacterium]